MIVVMIVIFMLIAGFDSHFGVLDGVIYCFQGRGAMAVLVVSGFLEVLAGLFKGFQSGLHVRLIFAIGGAGHCGWDAEKSKHQGERNCPLQSFHLWGIPPIRIGIVPRPKLL
jgi:ABC-type microcin C transport system permease subunit YejB